MPQPLNKSADFARILIAQHQMWDRALVKKRAQSWIIPTNDIVLVRQIEDHAVHVRRRAVKPGVGNSGREHSGTRSVEVILFENGSHRIASDVDIPPGGPRSPPIVFGRYDGALRFDRRAKLGTRLWRPFD